MFIISAGNLIRILTAFGIVSGTFSKPLRFANPTSVAPFDTNNSLFENVNSVKAIARHEKLLNLDDIFTISKRVLKTNGRLAMVHRTERLTQILDTASKYGFMAKKIRFIYPKENRNSDLMLIEFVKGGKKGLKMIYPLIVYDSDDNYNIEIKNMFGDDVHDTK